jgi:AcrR family transcriptional regulator
MARLTNLTGRGHETERQLRDVLIGLIVEKGYDHVSIKDITDRAGIDRTTFYLHFKDKDRLFEKSQRLLVDDLMAMREKRGAGYPGVGFVFEHMAGNRDMYLALWRSEGVARAGGSVEQYIAGLMVPILEAMLLENGIDASGDIEPVARYLTGALRGLARWWLEAGMPGSANDMAALFMRLARRGLGSYGDV